MEVLKDLLAADIEIWKKRIAESPDKSTVIDMMVEFEQFFSKTVIMISFGEDVTNQKFKMQYRVDPHGSEFVEREVNLPTAIHETVNQVIASVATRNLNPLY